jgi:hypothetical protein
MMRELLDLRKDILPATSASGIAKMREKEATYIKEIKFVMRTDENWKKYLVYQSEFYTKYLETLAHRAPAGDPAAKQ